MIFWKTHAHAQPDIMLIYIYTIRVLGKSFESYAIWMYTVADELMNGFWI